MQLGLPRSALQTWINSRRRHSSVESQLKKKKKNPGLIWVLGFTVVQSRHVVAISLTETEIFLKVLQTRIKLGLRLNQAPNIVKLMLEKNSFTTEYIHSPVCNTCVEFVGSVFSVVLLEDLLMKYNHRKPVLPAQLCLYVIVITLQV